MIMRLGGCCEVSNPELIENESANPKSALGALFSNPSSEGLHTWVGVQDFRYFIAWRFHPSIHLPWTEHVVAQGQGSLY